MHEFDYALMSGTVLKCIDFEWQGLFVCVFILRLLMCWVCMCCWVYDPVYVHISIFSFLVFLVGETERFFFAGFPCPFNFHFIVSDRKYVNAVSPHGLNIQIRSVADFQG